MAVIVIVGGGAAGAKVTHLLSARLNPRKHRLVLVTSRPQYINLLWALRIICNPALPLDTLFLPYDKLFGNFPGELKIANVTNIEENKEITGNTKGGTVLLSTGEVLAYDCLVLATGSVWEGMVDFPTSPKAYHEHVQDWRTRIEKANEVVIAGGGPVGIEISGEIRDTYPDKNITIVQGDRSLLSDVYPDRFRNCLVEKLQARGINIILNDAIKGNPPLTSNGTTTTITTRDGKVLECDLLLTCRGGGANTAYAKFLRPSPLTGRGYIRVTETLQVLWHESIFALGDIVDWPEVKQMAKINMGHGEIVVENVLSYVNGEKVTRKYSGTWDVMAVSIGKNRGSIFFGLLWGIVGGNILTRHLKSKTLLIEKVRENLGLDD
ncbi:hypothetical protein BKA70DRAFT_1402296 [Coprinopsis sp. MPI-PUGE-AT-0042]|nr:hypothetical protein BKA70DRAFT_1402296 [Coprinopsis sp. MPI-PUGE-AT-0042]